MTRRRSKAAATLPGFLKDTQPKSPLQPSLELSDARFLHTGNPSEAYSITEDRTTDDNAGKAAGTISNAPKLSTVINNEALTHFALMYGRTVDEFTSLLVSGQFEELLGLLPADVQRALVASSSKNANDAEYKEEEVYDAEDDSDTEFVSNKKQKLNKDGSERKIREPRGQLLRWDGRTIELALLGIVWACGQCGLKIDFDMAAQWVDINCTGSALQQAILKLHTRLKDAGLQLAPVRMMWPKKNLATESHRDPGKVPRRKPTRVEANQSYIITLKTAYVEAARAHLAFPHKYEWENFEDVIDSKDSMKSIAGPSGMQLEYSLQSDVQPLAQLPANSLDSQHPLDFGTDFKFGADNQMGANNIQQFQFEMDADIKMDFDAEAQRDFDAIFQPENSTPNTEWIPSGPYDMYGSRSGIAAENYAPATTNHFITNQSAGLQGHTTELENGTSVFNATTTANFSNASNSFNNVTNGFIEAFNNYGEAPNSSGEASNCFTQAPSSSTGGSSGFESATGSSENWTASMNGGNLRTRPSTPEIDRHDPVCPPAPYQMRSRGSTLTPHSYSDAEQTYNLHQHQPSVNLPPIANQPVANMNAPYLAHYARNGLSQNDTTQGYIARFQDNHPGQSVGFATYDQPLQSAQNPLPSSYIDLSGVLNNVDLTMLGGNPNSNSGTGTMDSFVLGHGILEDPFQ